MPKPVLYGAAAMLLLALIPLPYGYYQTLRLVATIALGWAAFAAHANNQSSLTWICAVLAVVFNPLLPIYLPRAVWMVIDAGTGIFLLVNQAAFMGSAKDDLPESTASEKD